MSSVPESQSSSDWTTVRGGSTGAGGGSQQKPRHFKGGAHKKHASQSFPEHAAAAFGRRPAAPRVYAERPAFNEQAVNAFGRKSCAPVAPPMAPARTFNPSAAAAFNRSAAPANARNEFDTAAAAAFGSSKKSNTGSNGFTDEAMSAFGKKKRVADSSSDDDAMPLPVHLIRGNTIAARIAAELGDEEKPVYRKSALQRQREAAAAPPLKRVETFEEAFPTLGSPAKSPAVASMTKSESKGSFADLVRKRAEADAAAESARARAEAEAAEKRARDERDARMYSTLRMKQKGRTLHTGNCISYNEYDDDGPCDDLDYDAMGRYVGSTDYSDVPDVEAYTGEDGEENDDGDY